MIPNSLSVHNQVIFCTLKYLLKLCQTRCTTTNHLCQITHHQFWNGNAELLPPGSQVLSDSRGFEREVTRSCCWKLPPPSFPGQCHGGLKVMITQLPLTLPFRLCVQSRAHKEKQILEGESTCLGWQLFIPLSMSDSRTTHGVSYKYVPVATTNFRAMFVHITHGSKNSYQGPKCLIFLTFLIFCY